MAVTFTNSQFQEFDRIAVETFFDDMRQSLFSHHKNCTDKDSLFAICRTECSRLGIESEVALFAFFDMSFALGQPVSFLPEYMDEHQAFLSTFHDPERLPLELYERAG